tara:strand:- start:42 stop:233 length:192 start_codon:yes stop_codon:yes gene_type:complete
MASGASKGAKKIKPFDEMDTRLAMGKTAKQQNATNMRNLIKDLTKKGKHGEAQAVYKEQFPKA